MQARVFIRPTKDRAIEISVLRHGMNPAPVEQYNSTAEAKAALRLLGYAEPLVDRKLKEVWQTPAGELLEFPVIEVPDNI
jgi:hypothetical protein